MLSTSLICVKILNRLTTQQRIRKFTWESVSVQFFQKDENALLWEDLISTAFELVVEIRRESLNKGLKEVVVSQSKLFHSNFAATFQFNCQDRYP